MIRCGIFSFGSSLFLFSFELWDYFVIPLPNLLRRGVYLILLRICFLASDNLFITTQNTGIDLASNGHAMPHTDLDISA